MFCKGRLYCGRKTCPIAIKVKTNKIIEQKLKEEFSGEAPNVFVGTYNYPNVNVGILSTEKYNEHDEPKTWSKKNYGIQDVINKRLELINSSIKMNVRDVLKSSKFNEAKTEVALSKKPVELELKLDKKPKLNFTFNQTITPFGPTSKLKDVKITQNPKIPYQIDKVVDDDVSSQEAISKLMKKYEIYYLSKILSSGVLGKNMRKKLVPTRWSITAIDDTVSKEISKELLKSNTIDDHIVYVGNDYGNYFIILMFPDVLRYEFFEIAANSKSSGNLFYDTDYENFFGRKEYAKEPAGGYYACRISVFNKLKELRKQASVLVIRFITDDYWAPLGVWVVRETVKKVLENKPIRFSSQELAILFAKKYSFKHFGINIKEIILKSKLLKEINTQKKLTNFQ